MFHDGWYFTGDRADRDEDGYFWFVGRADDVIISAAYRIGPFEVESALVEHPAVVESAVVGKPDPERDEIVKAFVVLAPGHGHRTRSARELQEHVKTVTAPYKYPREIEFVDDAAEDDQRQDPPHRAARALVTQLPPFAIERYFAVHEFAVPYLLCASNVETTPCASCWHYADAETRSSGTNSARLYGDARLAAAAAEIAGLYVTLEPDDVIAVVGPSEALFVLVSALVRPGDHVSRCGPRISRSTTSPARRARTSSWSSCGPRTAGRWTSIGSPPPCGPRRAPSSSISRTTPPACTPARRSSPRSPSSSSGHGATLVCDEVYRGLE